LHLTLRQAIQLLRSAASEEISPLELADILRALERPARGDAKARLARAQAARLVGKLADAARELEKLIDETDDLRLLADAHGTLGAVYRAQGRPGDALGHKQKALEIARALGDPERRAVALGEVGTALAALGRLREARAKHEQALATLRSLKKKTQSSRRHEGAQLSYLGVALHRAGHVEEARRAHTAALAIHRATKQLRLEGAELMHLGYVERERGRLGAARKLFERAERVLREAGDRALEGVVLSHRGVLEVEAERPEVAGPMLQQALAIHREAGSPRHEATTWLHLALHHLALGEDRETRAALERARDLGENRVEPEQHAWVLALLGDFESARAIAVEDPGTKRAIDLLSGAAPEKRPIASSRVRQALAIRKPGVRVAPDASWFESGGERVDLVRRGPLKRALARLLAARGASVAWQVVLEAGWPGERVLAEAGFARVRNAMFQLRKLGLQNALQTTSDGYRLDVKDR